MIWITSKKCRNVHFLLPHLRRGNIDALLDADHPALVARDGPGREEQVDLHLRALGLGLSIVRTLVTTELGGTIVMRAGTKAQFEAVGIHDARDGMGTAVHLTVPLG